MNKISQICYRLHLVTFKKVTGASKKIGTRGNPSSPLNPSPLNPGVSDPEQLLKEARRNLIFTSSEKFIQPTTLEIPESSSIPVPSFNPHSEKGREALDLLFTPN